MAGKKISELIELGVLTGDEFVEISKEGTSQKFLLSQLDNSEQIDSLTQSLNGLQTSKLNSSDFNDAVTELQNDIGNKQDRLISNTNVKTVGGNSILGSGDIPLPATVTVVNNLTTGGTTTALSAEQGKNLKSQVDGKQATLVSNGNIKTVGGQSLLGSGDIPLPEYSAPVNDLVTGGTSVSLSAEQGKIIKTRIDAKVDKAIIGNTITSNGSISASHNGKVMIADATANPIELTLAPGIVTSASDRFIYKKRGANPLSFRGINGVVLNDPHLIDVLDGDLVVIAGTGPDAATVVGMPGDMVRKNQPNTYHARQAIAPVELTIAGGVISIDSRLSNNYFVELDADAVLANPSFLLGGQAGTIEVINTGSFNLTFGTVWRPVVGAITAVKHGAGSLSIVSFKVSADGTKILYNIIQEQ